MRKKKKDKKKHPWRENLEAITMAIAVALLFKTFILEVSKIPSGSMQPTLMGSAITGVNDRVLVDKLSFQFRDPKRFEIVVFKHPLERSRVMVKRLVGMPNEEFRIEHGDLWTRPGPDAEWTVLQRPDSVMDEMWKRIDRNDPTRSSWELASGDAWRISGRNVTARGNGRARFRPNERSIRDTYVDGYHDSLRAEISSAIKQRNDGIGDPEKKIGVQHVGDLKLECDLTVLPGTEHVAVVLTEGVRTYEFKLPGPAAEAGATPEIRVRDSELYSGGDAAPARRPERIEQAAPLRLEAKESYDLSVRNLDDRLRLDLDGETLLEVDVDPAVDQRSSVSLVVRGDGADFEDLHLYRDVHYLLQGMRGPIEIPAGHYFMLGDNTQDSADGRQWQVVRMEWTDADGVEHSARGNHRPQPPNPSRATAALGRAQGLNPIYGEDSKGVAYYGFRDEWGNHDWFPREGSAPGLPAPAPVVPRHLIQGRALAVFWPLKPHEGLWRLGWLH